MFCRRCAQPAPSQGAFHPAADSSPCVGNLPSKCPPCTPFLQDDEAAPVTGPTNFANLRQLTGMGSGGPGGRGPKLPSATLVSRLAAPRHRLGKEPATGGSGGRAVDAASAVFEQVVQGLGGKK